MASELEKEVEKILCGFDSNRIKFVLGDEDDILWICFSSRGKKKFELYRTLTETKKHVLFVNDHVSGYYHDEITGLCKNHFELIELLQSIILLFNNAKIVCVGASMGGYGALLCGTGIKADQVIVFSPQINLNPILSLTPKEDSIAAFNDITLDIKQNKHTQYFVFCSLVLEDLYHIIDLRHCDHVHINLLNTVVSTMGHNILAELQENGYDLTNLFLNISMRTAQSEFITYNDILHNDFISNNIKKNVEHFYLKKFELCIDFFTKASYLFPFWSQATLCAAQCGNLNVGFLIKSIQIMPRASFLYYYLLLSIAKDNNFLSFDYYLDMAVLMGGDKVQILTKVAEILTKNKSHREVAFVIREKILVEDKNNYIALYAHGMYYLHLKQYESAKIFFDMTLNVLGQDSTQWRVSQSKVHISNINKLLQKVTLDFDENKIMISDAGSLGISHYDIRKFYTENWNRKIALSDEVFYEWQFIKSNLSKKEDCCIVAYDIDNKAILGVMGLNKRDFRLQDNILKGAELTTWVVSDKAKGRGLGNKMIKYIQENYDIAMGMGITDAALPIYMKHGFKYIQAVPRFIRVINFSAIKEFAQTNILGEQLINMRLPQENNDYTISDNVTADIEKISNSFHDEFICFSRTNNYLSWRYDEHPYFSYKKFVIKSQHDNIGVAIFMREEVSLSEFRILHIIDFFGNKADMCAAIKFIEDYALKNNFDIIDFYSTNSIINSYFIHNNWFSINDDKCFQFPHLFRPIEMRIPPTTSIIYWCKNNIMLDLSKLYITKQDADFDRPTLHQMT